MVCVGVCVICLSLSPPLPPLPSLCVNHRYHEDVKVEVCLCLCLCLYVFVACELKSRALSHNPRHPPPLHAQMEILQKLTQLDSKEKHAVVIFKAFHYLSHYVIITELLGRRSSSSVCRV